MSSIFSGLSDSGGPFQIEDAVDISGGLSLGVRVEEDSQDPTAVFLRVELPSLQLFGLSIFSGPCTLIHFQWFVPSELERRRRSILRRSAGASPIWWDIVSGCTVWKRYIGYVDDDYEICEDLLLDLDPYNQVMIVSANPSDGVDFPIRVDDGLPDEWYLNEIYGPDNVSADDDFLVVQLEVAEWRLGIVHLSNLLFLVIGNIGTNSVYINANLEISVLWLVQFEAAAAIQNFADDENPESWGISFRLDFIVDGGDVEKAAGFLGDRVGSAVGSLVESFNFRLTARSSPFTWGATQRRVLEEIAASSHRSLTPQVSGWDLDMEFVGSLLGEVFQIIGEVAEVVEQIAFAAYNFAKKALIDLLNFFESAGQFIKDAFGTAITFVSDFIENPLETIEKFNFESIVNGFNSGINAITNAFGAG